MSVLQLEPASTGERHVLRVRIVASSPIRPQAYRWQALVASTETSQVARSADMVWPGYDTAPSGMWVDGEREFVVELLTPMPANPAELVVLFEDEHGEARGVAVSLPAVASLQSHIALAAASQLEASAQAATWEHEADSMPVGALKQALAAAVQGGAL